MKYRAEIDGLRAVAVVPVILFHAGFEIFSGGFVGVDVFFVISGYLITTILIEEIENQRFSILNFYERRARRILPALSVVVIACIPFAWMWMLPGQMEEFLRSLIGVSLFISNILFWRESGYFESAAEEKPLLHTWSLAVEEQYYVLFPIFLFFAWRFGRNKVFYLILFFSAISLALSEWGWRNNPSGNFFLAPTRAWELFAGSLAAFIVQSRGVKSNNILAMLGFAAIIFAIFFYDERTPFPSLYALVPVLGVVLLILFADKDTWAAQVLSTKALVGIGLISYSAYLWHQPLYAFAKIYTLDQVSWLLTAALLIATFVLAYASYLFVEQPFRKRNVITAPIIYASSIAILVGFIIASFAIGRAYDARYDGTAIAQYAEAGTDWNGRNNLTDMNVRGASVFDPDAPVDVFIFGDSHAEQYTPLAEEFAEMGANTAFLTGGGCPPIPGVYDDLHPSCFNLLDRFDRVLEQNPSIERIVIAACFNCYFVEQVKPRGSTASKYDYYYREGDERLYFRDGEGVDEAYASLTSFLERLSIDYDVVLVGDNPFDPRFDPKVMSHELITSPHYYKKKYGEFDVQNFEVLPEHRDVNARLANAVPAGRVSFIDVLEVVCPDNTCDALNDDGMPVYRDVNHLRPWFVEENFPAFSAFLR